jgi:hypothetical protein
MRFPKLIAAAAVASGMSCIVPLASAQISINIGRPPACPYGYYDTSPYGCAPYGYYGSEWFNGGVFIGAGPWFHGPHGFYGHVNNHYDPHYGYHGGYPNHGDHPAGNWHGGPQGFHGNEMRDGQGHVGGPRGHGR